MEGKIWGILLSVLGITGLIGALIYINTPEVSKHLTILFAVGILGALAFFMGIWLIDYKSGRQNGRKTGLMRMAEPKLQQQGS